MTIVNMLMKVTLMKVSLMKVILPLKSRSAGLMGLENSRKKYKKRRGVFSHCRPHLVKSSFSMHARPVSTVFLLVNL
jgi:hypothetical protein